jgi:CRP/FNR family transcriptional regulator, cyclic AMP receptor protein
MSYENEVRQKVMGGEKIPGTIDLGVLRYLWQSGPLSFGTKETIPKFLKRVPVLNSFSDNELRVFSNYLHLRSFTAKEVVFRQGDTGYGFYFIYSGAVDVLHQTASQESPVAKLERYQYFGEMGLLQDYNRRNASVVAAEDSALLGLFKADLEALLDSHPVVGAKFLREISLILANRLGALMDTVAQLRYQLGEDEGNPA